MFNNLSVHEELTVDGTPNLPVDLLSSQKIQICVGNRLLEEIEVIVEAKRVAAEEVLVEGVGCGVLRPNRITNALLEGVL